MKSYAHIYNGQVIELFETDGDITQMFHPSLVWIECPSQVQQGWLFDGEAFVAPVVSPVSHAELKVMIAEERYRREGTGIAVDGLAIETTRDSQALIAGTGLSAILDPEYRCNFKTANGFVEIVAPQIITIAMAVRKHVQACFDRELILLRTVESGTYTNEMLDEGWPDSSLPTTNTAAQ
ncbi:DUF4376 domain-containing protein [Pseudomonas sp. P9_31]|uniref:DUF4376 domain-containing protein n=1 Tax=Pseudomonas sp. P9_31 TaxID=3043448 RepID=UPI002A35A75C|nr:DUF4376 domain-containing protein [Pseudomonas sp. P9_31]WPN56920.1 DUF4376 domain-containing protein [Pseudomonas sp. P9_31]